LTAVPCEYPQNQATNYYGNYCIKIQIRQSILFWKICFPLQYWMCFCTCLPRSRSNFQCAYKKSQKYLKLWRFLYIGLAKHIFH